MESCVRSILLYFYMVRGLASVMAGVQTKHNSLHPSQDPTHNRGSANAAMLMLF